MESANVHVKSTNHELFEKNSGHWG